MRTAMVMLPAAAGSVSVLFAALVLRRRHQTPLALPLALIIGGAAEWSLAQALSLAATTETVVRAFNYAIFPGVAIALLVLGFNFLGDGLRDRMDPRRQ